MFDIVFGTDGMNNNIRIDEMDDKEMLCDKRIINNNAYAINQKKNNHTFNSVNNNIYVNNNVNNNINNNTYVNNSTRVKLPNTYKSQKPYIYKTPTNDGNKANYKQTRIKKLII